LKKSTLSKKIAISIIIFIFLNISIIPTSLAIEEEIIEDVSYSECGINLITDPNLPPCYVMGNFTLPNNVNRSEKPNTFNSLPSEFSWKSYLGNDYTTPAKNQGSCGSCWAFAAVSCFESIINIAWDNPNLDIDLSEQYILSCLPVSGSCNGGYPLSAFKLIRSTSPMGNYHNGLIPEDCFPYRADDSIPCSEKCEDWENKLIPLADYGSWRPNYPQDIDAIKSSIMTYGPVVTMFYATGDFARWGIDHQEPTDYYPYVEQNGANHAVILVGWKDDSSIENGGYWIVKNSWGTNWGYDGFFNIEYGSLNIDNVDINWAKYEASPLAFFTHFPQNPKSEEEIQFIDTSQLLVGYISNWEWDFGDGVTSTIQNPTYKYTSDGTYNVSLTVTDNKGHVNAITKKVYVGDETPPSTSYHIYGSKGKNDWYTGYVIIDLSSVDSFSGIDKIWYNLDGQGYEEYNGKIYFLGKPDGEHTLSYYAVDNAGNKENEKSLSLKIDHSNPKIKVVKPKDNVLYFNNIPLFRSLNRTVIIGFVNSKYTIFDNGSGIEKVEFYLDNDLKKTVYEEPYSFVTSGRNIGSLSIIKVIAYDQAGLSSQFVQYVLLSSFGLLGFLN
jgi:PKD repeat protein